ncbi:MAG TPA: hypothetical protein VLA03_05140, partial [Draconibacterium sp.]|nr:hypothetical protein [Draconibacterium sp.]
IMKKLIGVIVVVLSVFVISCQKDQDLFIESELLSEKSAQIVVSEISVDNAMADINFESDFFIGAEGMMMGMKGGMQGGMHGGMNGYSMQNWNQGNGLHYIMGQYPQYSMHGNQTQYSDSIVMNYGMGTQLNNGRVMSGSMIIHTSEEPNGDGYSREITYENFSVDSMSITGMTKVFITGDHQNGGSHMISDDLMITMPDGTTIHRQSEIVREWMEGSETNLDQTDDVMKVTGHVINTVNENGTETGYRKDILEPLIKSSNCRYFSQGIIELLQAGSVIATLDYGNGECDDIALLSKDGEEPVEIILSENDHCSNNQNSGMGMGNSNGQQHGTGMGQGTSSGAGMGQGSSTGTGHGTGMGQGHGNG